MKTKARAIINEMKTSPPTTPPAMAAVCDLCEDGAVAVTDVADGKEGMDAIDTAIEPGLVQT
jgi:hypothetical protein